MRPNAQPERSDDNSGTIIYLGDVRRRRAVARRAPDRQYLAAIALAGALAWICWLLVLFTIPPQRLLTFAAFFTPFWIGVCSLGALCSYAIQWRHDVLSDLRTAMRRGALLATVATVNLALLGAHRWAPFLLGLTVLGAILVDVFVGRREY